MLAQNFKTPTDLGITEQSIAALMSVLTMLERDEFKHRQISAMFYLANPEGAIQFFNMKAYRNNEDCGTIVCIKGAAEILAGIKTTGYEQMKEFWGHTDYPSALRDLFLPANASKISTAQAAIALRNYLTHGEPRWAEAMSA